MKRLCKIILFLYSLPVFSDEIVVVTGKESKAAILTQTQVANLFLGRNFGDTIQLTPFDQDDAQLRERFYREVVGMSLTSVRAYWAKRVFTGRGRPPKVLKADEIGQQLEKQGSVTYFLSEQQPEDAEILFSTQGEQP